MFKVEDKVVCTDDFEGRTDLTTKEVARCITVKKITGLIDDWGLELNDGEHWVAKGRFRHATPEEIAAGHRIDKSPLMQHLDKCEELVKTWPKWKLQSIRDAFGIPVLANDMGDDSHIENHISKNCKVIDYEID